MYSNLPLVPVSFNYISTQENRRRCGLGNLPMELWKFGENELRIQLLELFNPYPANVENRVSS
jgi:hypothetical protein